MALNIFLIIIGALGNVAVTAIVYFLLPLIKPLNKLKQIYRDLIIGTLFLIYNIVIISFGIYSNDPSVELQFSACVIAPLVVALLYNWPAALVTGIGSFLYRTFYNFTSPDRIRYASAAACLIAILIGILLQRFVFNSKKGLRLNYIYGFFIGFFTETVRLFATIVANMNDMEPIYSSIVSFDIASIVVSGVVTALCVLLMMIYKKESIRLKLIKDDRIGSKIQKRIFIATVVSFIIAFFLTSGITRSQTINSSGDELNRAGQEIDDVIKACQGGSDQDNDKSIVNTAKNRRILKNGYAIIVTDAKRNYLIKSIPEKTGKKIDDAFVLDNKRYPWQDSAENEPLTCNYNNETVLLSWRLSKTGTGAHGFTTSYYVITIIPEAEIRATYGISIRVSIYLQLLIFSFLYIIVVMFINRKVVHNINKINGSLEEIMEGNLNAKADAGDSREFISLSQNINLAVNSLKSYSNEISRRLAQENELAINIQKNSVMNVFPNEQNFEVYGSMRTAKEVGGDFYEYVKLSDDKVVLLIADVVGAGIAAAMYMVRAKTFIKSLLVLDEKTNDIDLAAVVNKVNKEFANDNIMKDGMSLWIGLLDMKTNILKYVNADHETPLVCLEDEIYKRLPCKQNVYIGLEKDYNYEVETITFSPGSEILLYTDGVLKVRDKHGKMFGGDAFIELTNNAKYFTMKQLVQNINDGVDHYSKDGPNIEDDLTFLCFAFTGLKEKKPEHEITLKAIPNNTPIATKFVESIMQQYNCSQKSQAIMLIAVDELFSNIAYYAYKGKEGGGNGTIRIEIKGTQFKMQLIDNGTPFNPLAHLDPNYINSSAEERTNKGGLGIFMVRRSVDDMQYVYENGQNILTIIKTIPEMHEEEFKDSYSTTRD